MAELPAQDNDEKVVQLPRKLDASTVREAARGRWGEILPKLGVPPWNLKNRHGPCPGCGGKDRFRFDDKDGNGTFICSQGGGGNESGDGFALLQHVNGWGFRQALEEVADAAGVTAETTTKRRQKAPVVAQYVYEDSFGNPYIRVNKRADKSFSQQRWTGQAWQWGVKGMDPVPYRLPEVCQATAMGLPVYIAEGEKDADSLRWLGFTATCNAGGAGNWPKQFGAEFAGVDVTVFGDNDAEGRRFVKAVADSVRPYAASVRTIIFDELPEKGDVSDWIDARDNEGLSEEEIADALRERQGGALEPEPEPEPENDAPTATLDTFEDDDDPIPPRGWLLGTTFCRGFISGTVGAGGTGKTAIRHAQLLSLATGHSLTGEHVHQRARVLIVSLEDGRDELRRRIRATRLHHGISTDELSGWLHLATPGGRAGKLMELGEDGTPTTGALYDTVCRTIEEKQIDVVSFDPFVKLHSLEENSNSAIDDLMVALTDIADKYGVAVDLTHHTRKGLGAPGDAEVGRGASAVKDAMRLLSTVATMTADEAKQFEIAEEQRRKYVRLDSGKVNIAPAAGKAKWFKLVGVPLDNATEAHPNGDTVQTVEPWHPPDTWSDVSCDTLNRVLDDIAAGLPDGTRYSDASSATSRAAWKVVQKHAPDKSEHQARTIIRTWVKTGVLVSSEYHDPSTRKQRQGLTVNDDKRPGDLQP